MKTETISQAAYSTFIGQITGNQVWRVILRPHSRIDYHLKPEFGGARYTTTQPAAASDDLLGLLRTHQVEFSTVADTSGAAASLVGLLISTGALVGAFAWLTRSGAGGLSDGIGSVMGTGKSKARTYSPSASKSKSQGKAAVYLCGCSRR